MGLTTDINCDIVVNKQGGLKEITIEGKPKTMFHLLEPYFVEGVADVLTLGALKYSPDNWKKVNRDEYERAMYHHLNEYLKGIKNDEESGKSHLFHVACNAMFLNWFDNNQTVEKEL